MLLASMKLPGMVAIEVRSTGFNDVVVWNPGQEAGRKMGDMEDNGWEHFICVEPGSVASFVNLAAGSAWSGQQVLTVL